MPSSSFSLAAAAETLNGGSGLGVSSLGHSIDWSGVKLSAPVLEMLNVVALAALKMTENNSDAPPATQPPTPRLQHSI